MSETAPTAPRQLMDERELFLEAKNGLKLRLRIWGEKNAPTIVLLHGLRGFSGTWRSLAQTLSQHYRLIALDQRGRGDSDWDPNLNYYTDAYLEDLESVIEHFELERFFLLGHSMGGTTSYVYAAENPERLHALIIEDIAPGASISGEGAERIKKEMAALPLEFASWEEARAYWRKARPSVGEEGLNQRLAESLRETDDGRIAWRYDARGISATRLHPDPARVVDLWPVVDRIQTPTLIIRGEKSDFCAMPAVEQMLQRNPQMECLTVAGASHYVHDDASDIFNTAVKNFLDKHNER